MEIAQKAAGVSFVSNDGREFWTVKLLWAFVGLGVIAILADLVELDLLTRMINDIPFTEEEAKENDTRQRALAITKLVLFLTTGIVYCNWLQRAYFNLLNFGLVDLEYDQEKAVSSYFIPFVHLYRPLRVTQELWKGSDPRIDPSDPEAWKRAGVSKTIGHWWTAWILMGLTGQFIVFHNTGSPNTLDQVRNYNLLSIASAVFGIVAAVLAIKVIQGISRRQNVKGEKMGFIKVSSTQFE